MNCKDFDALLDSHTAGAQSTAGKAEIAQHLEHCRRCADAWLSHEALAGEPMPPVRSGFGDAAIASAIAGALIGPPAARRADRRLTMLGLAAAVLIALALAWLWLPGSGAPQDTPAFAGDAANGGDSAETPDGFAGNTPRFEPDVPGYVAGIHYRPLATPAPTTAAEGQIEVCEFFMFGCIHCYNFEPMLTSWAEARADRIDLVRVPALFSDLARLHAQAFYTAEVMGELERLTQPFYAEIHERGRALASVAEIRELFVSNGVDGARFDANFNSAPVIERLRRADELNRLYRVDSTPSLGVNGRYLSNAAMAGSYESLLELVDALVEAEIAAEAPCEGQDSACEIRRRLRQAGPTAAPGGAQRF